MCEVWFDGNKVAFFSKKLGTRNRPKQRWSPQGHNLKSLALASKVKSLALALASRPQVLENWPVLGSRTAVFFGMLKFCGVLEKLFGKRFFVEIAWNIFVKTFSFFFFFFFFFRRSPKKFLWRPFFFFLESTCVCVLGPWPWPRAFLFLASRASVLGKAVLGLGLGFFLCVWPWPRALCPRLHLWPKSWGLRLWCVWVTLVFSKRLQSYVFALLNYISWGPLPLQNPG